MTTILENDLAPPDAPPRTRLTTGNGPFGSASPNTLRKFVRFVCFFKLILTFRTSLGLCKAHNVKITAEKSPEAAAGCSLRCCL